MHANRHTWSHVGIEERTHARTHIAHMYTRQPTRQPGSNHLNATGQKASLECEYNDVHI